MCDICLIDAQDMALYGHIFVTKRYCAHYYCLLSSDIPQRGLDNSGIYGFRVDDIKASLPQIRNKICFICSKASAAVRCSYKGCTRTWHFICGRKNSCITQFIDKFNSYCHEHLPDLNKYKHGEAVMCPCCYKTIRKFDIANSIISDCCLEIHKKIPEQYPPDYKKCAFVHSNCMQKYAFNAGHDTMCVCCCMKPVLGKESYQRQLRLRGIFVPVKAATWESEGYFDKMTKYKCGDPKCATPSVTKGVWTCFVCGCHPLHLSCAGVSSHEQYLCIKCTDQSFVNLIPSQTAEETH